MKNMFQKRMKRRKMKNDELYLDVTSEGEIRFRRGDKEYNDAMLQILSQLAPHKVSELKEFFEEGDEIELLMGGVVFCG